MHRPTSRHPRRTVAAARRPRNKGRPGWLAGCACLLLLGCATPTGLVVHEAGAPLTLADDGSALSLARAIGQSIAYYERLPPETRFSVGPDTYTPAEMIASLELFQAEYLSAPDAETLTRRLNERFHVIESVREAGPNLFTGYYEPELAASPTSTAELDTPVYALPPDLVKVRLARFGDDLPAQTLMGRLVDGELIPYFTRAEIEAQRALRDRAERIAYVNRLDLFFLQIQGSGVLRFPDGRREKVGYAGSNGHPYRSIGAYLVRTKALELEQVSLQSIRAYLVDNPQQVEQVLHSNPSYVFFTVREDGPYGNLGVPLTPRRSLAVDQRLLPPGALVYVATEAARGPDPAAAVPVRRFMLVQDTGGAIRGHGRADLFWGTGAEAEWIAGHQKHDGRLLVLVARKTYLRRPTAEARVQAR